MSATKIHACFCEHAYQDTKYGKGQRVFNAGKTEGGKTKWRCTVCGKQQG